MSKINIVWFRRDLRLHDNAALYHALRSGSPVLPLFIFDTHILDELEDKKDARVHFIHHTLTEMNEALANQGTTIDVRYGKPEEIWQQLTQDYQIGHVYTNHDFEPYAIARDGKVKELLEKKGIALSTFKDHVIFEKNEVLKNDGTPYTVFTPYSRKWKEKLESRISNWQQAGETITASFFLKPYPTEKYFDGFIKMKPLTIPSLSSMSFEATTTEFPPKEVSKSRIKHYNETRNFPADEEGTTHLGIHYRFGTISIRQKALRAIPLSETYLNELIWRDFYAMILAHFPHVATGPFRPKYAKIEWHNDKASFKKWCEGKTGYPLVDAGMRQLNATGYMHNRVRMVVASFLTKHLLIDWRWGEAYFAAKLLDFDLASNNGGWQWAAGCGTDAAPYFRIFNPESQKKKFDKEEKYVRKWLPEYGTSDYPAPIVDHKFARERCLATYKRALNQDRIDA